MCNLLKLTDEEVEKLPVENGVEIVYSSEINNCKPGKLCSPEVFFEQINECLLCGKLM